MSEPRILILADEGKGTLRVRQQLEGSGYRVHVVNLSDREPIQESEYLNADLALIDLDLYASAGEMETAHSLRAQLNIPVICLATH